MTSVNVKYKKIYCHIIIIILNPTIFLSVTFIVLFISMLFCGTSLNILYEMILNKMISRQGSNTNKYNSLIPYCAPYKWTLQLTIKEYNISILITLKNGGLRPIFINIWPCPPLLFPSSLPFPPSSQILHLPRE